MHVYGQAGLSVAWWRHLSIRDQKKAETCEEIYLVA
jgi:hypothetical protein